VITFVLPSHSVVAATFIWDPLLNALGSDGAGNWDNTTANWALDGVDVPFPTSAQTTLTVALATGASTITVSNTAGLAVGQVLSSDRFPAGTVISAIDTDTNVVTLDQMSTNTLAIGSAISFLQSRRDHREFLRARQGPSRSRAIRRWTPSTSLRRIPAPTP
jgi:hypothetical protein